MKKLFFYATIITMLPYAGFAESKTSYNELKDKQREVQNLSDAYIKKYHGLPKSVAQEAHNLTFAKDNKGRINQGYQNYVRNIRPEMDAAFKNRGGYTTVKPTEYLRQDYKNQNEFQQSVGNANEYRKTLSPAEQALVPAIPKNYGSDPAHRVDFLAYPYSSEDNKTRTYGPPASRKNMVVPLPYAPNPVKSTPEQEANFNRTLKRAYYKQLMAQDPNYNDAQTGKDSSATYSDVVASAAANKARAQQLLGRPIKTEADAEAAVKLLQDNPLTIEGPGISKQEENEMTDDQYMLKRPSSRKFYIKALPGVARNETNKKPRAGKDKTLFHV